MIKLMADSACDLEQTEADALGIAITLPAATAHPTREAI